MRISETIKHIGAPPIPVIVRAAAAYAGTYGPLIDLCQGAPADPPHDILKASIASAYEKRAASQYSGIRGMKDLRDALADEMHDVYGGEGEGDVKGEDVALTAGCNMAFYASMMVLCEKGDEVILPVPWYWNHQMTLQMQGVNVVKLPLDESTGFLPTVEKCEPLITSKTKAIALVSPNNPTGATCPPALLHSFYLLAKKHNIALVLDETYRDFISSGPPHDVFSFPDWRSTFVHLFSFSKSYAVPGYRLGAVVAGEEFLKALDGVLDCIQISPPSLIQLALLPPILPSLRTHIAETSSLLHRRRTHFASILPPTWRVDSTGGYFALVRHPFYPGMTSVEVCERLAREVGVMLIPGSAFAEEGKGEGKGYDERYDKWVRVAVANVDEEGLSEAVRRLRVFEGNVNGEEAGGGQS